MKKINIILIWSLIIGVLTSCNNFDEINTDPNAATKVTPSLLATGLILNILKPAGGKTFLNPTIYAKQMAWGEGTSSYQYNDIGRTDFGSYHKLISAKKLIELSASQNPDAYLGLATFVKAYSLYYVSMEVGDIPYSDALKGEEGGIKPKYDTQKDVMLQVLSDLEKASDCFGRASTFTGDPILKGDVSRWKKVVTAFQLKVLMNLSKKESDADLKVKERFASLVAGSPLMESNDDNFQLVYSNKANQIYPLYKTETKYNDYPILSSTIIDVMKEFQDYRLFYYAAPSKMKIESGLEPNNWNAYVGVDPSWEYAKVTDYYTRGEFCNLNLRYKENPAGEPFIRLGYAEQNFILAEAAVRGWITGSASSYYKKAIAASMHFIADNTPDDIRFHKGRQITEDVITAYLNNPAIQLNQGEANGLEMIMTQRYLASFMQHGWDIYFDYRRTGYPVLPINPVSNQNTEKTKIPARWMYPQNEANYNRENMEEAINRQYGGSDDVNKLMWILQ